MTLLHRRMCLVPTWRGWLVFLAIGIAICFGVLRGLYPFLAVNDSRPGGVLVVEGWGAEDMMRDVLAEFQREHYETLFVTGGPIEESSPFAEYKSFAELGAMLLKRVGGDPKSIQPVPAPKVVQDRTYASAIALKTWMREHGVATTTVNLMSGGAHSRRSRLLFQKAFGDSATVGVIASPDREFDPRRWWASSAGFRTVTGEAIAYLYARLLFRPRGD